MSSILKKMARGKHGKRKRSGTNTRGRKIAAGGAGRRRNVQGPGYQFVTKQHDLERADPECRTCHGTGTKPTAYVQDGKARLLACSCVPMKEAENG
jgi:hypothetical protein